MSKWQKRIKYTAVALIVGRLLFPPYQHHATGYAYRYHGVDTDYTGTDFLFALPSGAHIDLTLLAIQCGVVALIAWVIYSWLGSRIPTLTDIVDGG